MEATLYSRSRGAGRHGDDDDDDDGYDDEGGGPTELDLALERLARPRRPAAAAAPSDVENERVRQQLADASFQMRPAAAGAELPGAAMDYEPDAVFEPGSYYSSSFDDLDRRNRREIPDIDAYWDECQLCNLDQTEAEAEGFDGLERLKLAADKNQACMDPVRLAQFLHRIYDATVRPGLEAEGCPPMRTRMFWQHFDEHAPSIRWMMESSVRTMTNALRVLRDEELFETDTRSGRRRTNKVVLSAMMKLEKERRPYLKNIAEMRAASLGIR